MTSLVLLDTGFRLEGARLFRTHARLFFDRIELSAWQLGRRYRREVPLGRIEEVDWTDQGATFALRGGESLTVALDEPERWRASLEACQRRRTAPPINLSIDELVTYTTTMA